MQKNVYVCMNREECKNARFSAAPRKCWDFKNIGSVFGSHCFSPGFALVFSAVATFVEVKRPSRQSYRGRKRFVCGPAVHEIGRSQKHRRYRVDWFSSRERWEFAFPLLGLVFNCRKLTRRSSGTRIRLLRGGKAAETRYEMTSSIDI